MKQILKFLSLFQAITLYCKLQVKYAMASLQLSSKSNTSLEIGDVDEGDPLTPGMFRGDPFDMLDAIADEIGDFEDGDIDDGDPAYDTALETGDLEGQEVGALTKHRIRKRISRVKKAVSNIGHRGRKKRAGKAAAQLSADRAAAGKLNANDTIKFITGKGIIIQSIDLFPNEANFPALLVKGALDRGQLESPGINLIETSATPGTEFGTNVGATSYYLYPFYIIKLGVSMLNGVSNQTITITLKTPVLNGTRYTAVVTAQLKQGFDGTLVVYPFQIVQGKAVFVYGKVGGDAGTTDEILVTINGLPTGAVASVIVPLSEHPLYKEMQYRAS